MKLPVLKLLLLLSFVLANIEIKTVHAEESTPSSATTETTQELKRRIEKAVEEKREQIKGALQGIAADQKGFIGEVQRVTDEAITVKSNDQTTIIPISENIDLSRKNSAIKIGDVAVGNWAVVIGKESSTGVFSPEKVVVSTETLQPKPQVIVIGSIDAITTKDVTVTSRLNGQKYAFTISKDSQSENNDGTTIPIRTFKKDLQVLLVGVEGEATTELKTIRALAPLTQ